MGIKTSLRDRHYHKEYPLKNLPTTWGLRLATNSELSADNFSEKPPHHMGIKTQLSVRLVTKNKALKNLPTTWGLRLSK